MKRRFAREYSLNEEIEKIVLAYYRETNEVVSSLNIVPEYDNNDQLRKFVVYVEYEQYE
jgi:hypothetical protein